MTAEELKSRIEQYRWYHSIDLGNGVKTDGAKFDFIWDFIRANMKSVELAGRSVLDVGCRDGLFSFMAENNGAASIVGIDNDLSPAVKELLVPHFQSKVQFHEVNLYDYKHDPFDVVMMFGVIYHLRYPFFGLRKIVNLTRPGGTIVIEGGTFLHNELPLLFCPFKDENPYEAGSPSFFNQKGITAAMDSMGCTLKRWSLLPGSEDPKKRVARGFFEFTRTHAMPEHLQQYWEGLHHEQSRGPQTYRKQQAGHTV